MPKQIKTLEEFDGGFVDFSDARDINDKDAEEVLNFAVRNVGKLKLLGGSIANSDIADIPLAVNLGLLDNDNLFSYSTDINFSGSSVAEKWIAVVNITDGQLYLHHASGTKAWVKIDNSTNFTRSIPALLGTMTEQAAYYFADGVLRVSNPTDNAEIVANQSTGCTSLWVGHIKRDFLSAVTVSGFCDEWVEGHNNETNCNAGAADHTDDSTGHWTASGSVTASADGFYTYGAPLIDASSTTFLNSLTISKTNVDTGAGVSTVPGKFSLKACAVRGKGDGTLKLNGRTIYVTYSFDGNQETIPFQVGTITSSDLPDALTESELGYIASTISGYNNTYEVGYYATEMKLNRDVRVQPEMDYNEDGEADEPNFKNWDNVGSVITIDKNGQTQTLTYSNITDDSYNIGTLTYNGTTRNLVLANDTDMVAGQKITISGTGVTNLDEDSPVEILTRVSATEFTYVGSVSIGNASASVGTVKVYNQCKLTGLGGWVETGCCAISSGSTTPLENVVQSITVNTAGTDATTDGVYTHTEGSGTSYLTNMAANFDATITVTGGGVTNVTITDHGNGHAIGEIVTTEIENIAGLTGCTLVVTMSGAITSETFCGDMTGHWNEGAIAYDTDITYDPPGEIEQQDENLGIKFILSGMPYSAHSVIAPEYGGNRLTHINIYTNKYEDDLGTIAEADDYAYITSFDLVNGWKESNGDYRPWNVDTGYVNQSTTYSDYFGSMFTDNFQSRTSMFPDTAGTDCRWKTAVVMNRRVYAGNVRMKDDNGNYKKFPDRILKSLPNKFDTFPVYDTLDVVVDDGDEIVKLESFGGKLLQFKKETLYVIDVTSQPEFLAGSFKYRGIASESAAKRTDFGVVFANKYGAFLFNGEDIKQLVQGKIEAYWKSWAGNADNVSVVFNPYNNYAIFKKSGDDNFLVHDFITSSWVKGSNGRMKGSTTSDWFIYEGEMTYANKESNNSIKLYKWEDDASKITFLELDNSTYLTKEFVFDNPVVDTRIHNLKITYKTGDTNASNMKAELLTFDGTTHASPMYLGTFSGSSDWKTVEFKLSPSITCKSAQIKISSMSDSYPIDSIATYDSGNAISIEDADGIIVDGSPKYVSISGTGVDDYNKTDVLGTYIDATHFSVPIAFNGAVSATGNYKIGKVPNSGFEINDITIVYRSKRIK